jgi:mevalonate kinase
VGRAVDALDPSAPQRRALERADAWERIFHGNPSGIDTAAAFHGTFMRFSKAEGARPLASATDLHLAVGHSGTSASTKEMVEGVARIKARKPEQIEKFLAAVTSLVQNAELALAAGDVKAVGQLMDLNQMLLAGLLLSTERIEDMCRIARAEGALGVKLTGSGGGGSVIALAASPEPHRDADAAIAIVEAWKRAGYGAFATRVRGRSRNEPETESR